MPNPQVMNWDQDFQITANQTAIPEVVSPIVGSLAATACRNSIPERQRMQTSIVDLKSTARATVPMGTEAVATLIIPRRKKQQMTDASAMTTNQDDTNRSRREICGTPGLVLPERNHGQGSQGDQRPNWLQQRFNVTRKQTCQPFANVARFCESEQTRFFPLRLNL
jgi:hypothetical protein